MSDELMVSLASIASCFEGVIPSSIATVDDAGVPNVTYLSVVHRIDENHVALSRQFFKKTEQNAVATHLAKVNVIEPSTGRQFLLDLVYDHTETEGALFERMRTRLDAVAAIEGMSNIFTLRGVDVCRVTSCEMVPCDFPEGEPPRSVSIEKLETASRRIAAVQDMEELLQSTLAACGDLFGYDHAFIMLVDESGERLYTVASSGYPQSGAGSEVRVGEGMIGLAAARRQSIRFTQMARDLTYSQASRETGAAPALPHIEQEIPLPTLPTVRSQLVSPMLAYRELVGVLCLQSANAGAFQAADESVVGIIANQAAMAMAALRSPEPIPTRGMLLPKPERRPVQVKRYCEDDSIFLDNEYLIKGVAGGILWRLLKNYADEGRVDYSNKEIRLDSTLDLPDIKDNLEARLILLRKRLEERCDWLRIERTARGRFRLVVDREIALVEIAGNSPV